MASGLPNTNFHHTNVCLSKVGIEIQRLPYEPGRRTKKALFVIIYNCISCIKMYLVAKKGLDSILNYVGTYGVTWSYSLWTLER